MGRQLRQLLMLLLMMFGAQSFALGFDPTCGHEESPICAHCAFLAQSGREQDIPLSTAAYTELVHSGKEFPHFFEAVQIGGYVDESAWDGHSDQEILISTRRSCIEALLLHISSSKKPHSVPITRRFPAGELPPRGPPSLLTQNVAA